MNPIQKYEYEENGVIVTIRDTTNIVLYSLELSQAIVSAVSRLIRDVIVQGLQAIVISLDYAYSEIEMVLFEGRIRRRLRKVETVVAMFSEAKRKAEEASMYDESFRREWIRRIEQLFYEEISKVQ